MKTGRPKFPVAHRTMNVYLPNDLHDRLGKWAAHLKCSKSKLIRAYVEAALDDAEVDAVVGAKQAKVLR